MDALVVLWLPILVSAVSVFVVSSLVHMLFKWHASDYRSLPNEDAVREVIRAGQPPPGTYVLPHCADMKAMSGEPMARKYREGPVGFLTLTPNNPPPLLRSLGQWFGFSILVSAIAAVLAAHYVGLTAGGGQAAAKFAGSVAFLAYGFGSIQQGIWEGKPWSSVLKYLLDAALYSLATALVFGWLWP